MVAHVPDAERFQRHAAERLLDDEAWRDGLEDSVSARLLDGVLSVLDASIAVAARSIADRLNADPAGAASASESLDDLAYQAADQARALLDTVAGFWRGHSLEEVLLAAGPALGGPLFASPDVGRRRMTELIEGVAAVPGAEPAPPAPRQAPGPPARGRPA
jgi:hypothetical protein